MAKKVAEMSSRRLVLLIKFRVLIFEISGIHDKGRRVRARDHYYYWESSRSGRLGALMCDTVGVCALLLRESVLGSTKMHYYNAKVC